MDQLLAVVMKKIYRKQMEKMKNQIVQIKRIIRA